MAEPREKRRVVIVGAGFAGFNAARELSKLVSATTPRSVGHGAHSWWSARATPAPRSPRKVS